MFGKVLVGLCFVLYAVAASEQRDPSTDSSREYKLGLFSPTGIGGVIGTLGILKLKALFVSLIVLAVATVFSKIFSSCGAGGFPCGADAIPASAHSNYNDYGYGWNSQRNAKSLSDTYNEFLAGVSESLDMVEGGFKTLGIETETCKKKFVCLADNEALENPILGLAFKIFGASMNKYRDGRTSERIHKDCDLLYPECTKGLPGTSPHQEGTGFQRIHSLLWEKQHVSS